MHMLWTEVVSEIMCCITNTNANKLIFQEQSPYTCKRTNVKQVVGLNMNIHYKKVKNKNKKIK